MTASVLDDYVTLQRGTTYQSKLLDLPGPVLLGLASIKPNGGFRSDSLRTYGGESPEKMVLTPGDIYVSLKDVTQSANLLGAVSRVPETIDSGRLTQDTVKLVFKRKDVPKNYIYWLLRTPQYRAYCRTVATGTTNLGLSREDFLSFPVPELTQQRVSLINLLEVLEKKIELNCRMNATLEVMAQAIFTSWFVDFDPVRAKAEGRQPEGMDEETAALFPDGFETVDGREVPVGWSAGTLGQIADVIDCLHAKKPDRKDSGRPFLQLSNIRDDGLIDMTNAYHISEEDYQKWISRIEASEGDCVITNVGRVGAVSQIPKGFKAALGRNMTAIRCKSDFNYPTFLIELLLSDFMQKEIAAKTDDGTILSALNVRNIPKLKVIIPPIAIVSKFESIARPIRRKMEENLKQSHTLTAIRDALLPKLISGELRVPTDSGAPSP